MLENKARSFAEKGILFATPFQVAREAQQEIIAWTRKNGELIIPENVNERPFWIGMGLTSVPPENSAHVDPAHRGRWFYYMRLNNRVGWRWNQNPIADLTREILRPLEPYFLAFTRVTVILQIPHEPLIAHRDLVPDNEYSGLESAFYTYNGDKRLRYMGEEWLKNYGGPASDVSHAQQGYLNLKIPLSIKADSPGKPFILQDGRKYYYNSEGKMLFLNEVEMEHGADAVDFDRGVIFVDGIFNSKAFKDLPRRPVQLALEPRNSW